MGREVSQPFFGNQRSNSQSTLTSNWARRPSTLWGARFVNFEPQLPKVLRILGLLAAGSSPTPPSLIALEEPENGVHPRRIELIAEYLRTQARRGASQLIVTTHSPTLLDQLPAASLYVVTRDHGSTTVLPYTSWGPLANASSIRDNLDGKEISGRVSDLVLSGELDA